MFAGLTASLPPTSFGHRDNHHHLDWRVRWPSHVPSRSDFTRALTSPSDVEDPPRSAGPTLEPQDHKSRDRRPHASNTRSSEATAPLHILHESSPASKRASPSRSVQGEALQLLPAMSPIAPSAQVPHSINDNVDSLSELAAQASPRHHETHHSISRLTCSQITCFFWFESFDVLQRVEDSTSPLAPFRPLVVDARPSSGFRKWVNTIFHSTRIAQNVVLLALLFVYRLKKINPKVRGTPGSEYRLLTVALMLGNKFLDDNTYTNRTWAEVSGINVKEMHIMEVEFLSNMKYCLYASAQEWDQWQMLLGKFATFFEKASKLLPPGPILPPASSLHLPLALPSPPASNEASPPYASDLPYGPPLLTANLPHGPTPTPSPVTLDPTTGALGMRKRSCDDGLSDAPSKRLASTVVHHHASPQRHHPGTAVHATNQQPLHAHGPRLPLPSLPHDADTFNLGHVQPWSQSHNPLLPHLITPATRAMVMSHSAAPVMQAFNPPVATVGPSSYPLNRPHPQASRHASPCPGESTATTPNHVHSAPTWGLPDKASPSHFLQQRPSPYRPVHHVSTLLYPPPPSALQPCLPQIEHHQMHYQPLGKSVQQRQTGQLPYVAQNVWLDGSATQTLAPAAQWPGFAHLPPSHHQYYLAPPR